MLFAQAACRLKLSEDIRTAVCQIQSYSFGMHIDSYRTSASSSDLCWYEHQAASFSSHQNFLVPLEPMVRWRMMLLSLGI